VSTEKELNHYFWVLRFFHSKTYFFQNGKVADVEISGFKGIGGRLLLGNSWGFVLNPPVYCLVILFFFPPVS